MKIGVLGLGYWGPNLVRNFLSLKEVSSVVGCDIRQERLDFIASRYPSVSLTKETEQFFKSDLDAIAIATPVDTHFKYAKRALKSGKHIWVEKPFTHSSAEAEELIEIAYQKNLNIHVDHTFIYTGAVKKIKELVYKKVLGDIIYLDSVRINLGIFQKDVNVIWDLAPHDLSIMNYILSDKKVVGIAANGIANYYDYENIAHISVYFEDNCFAHFHVNWTSPVKIRKMVFGGKEKMLIYNDMENFEKIKIYDCGIEMESRENIYEALVQYRIGDMHSPKITQTEALTIGANEFLESIKAHRPSLTNAIGGLEVVRILEAADKSIKKRGEIVEIRNLVYS